MTTSDLQSMRTNLADMKANLARLKDKAEKIFNIIEGGGFVPDTLSDALSEAIKAYRENSALLQQAGTLLSFSFEDGGVEQLESSIDACEKALLADSARSIVLDYFRLTADAEDVRESLERSKAALSDKCRASGDTMAETIEAPYRIVVGSAKDRSVELSDDNFDIIYTEIDKKVAHAAQKHLLLVNSEADVSTYLDGSCKLLAPAEPRPDVAEELPGEKAPVADEGNDAQVAEANRPVALNPIDTAEKESGEKDDGEESEVETEAVCGLSQEHYDGCTDVVSVSFTDTSPEQLGASKFINAAKQRHEMVIALSFAAEQKLLTGSEVRNEETEYYAPDADLTGFLKKEKYLMDMMVHVGKNAYSFLALTSKGWAVYSKSDVVKFIRARKMQNFLVSKHSILRTAEWTSADTARIVAFQRYYAAQESPENYFVWTDADSGIQYSFSQRAAKQKVLAAFFKQGNASAFVEFLRREIEKVRKTEGTRVIITASRADIRRLCSALCLDENAYGKIRFCVSPNYSVLLDYSGAEKPFPQDTPNADGADHTDTGDTDEDAKPSAVFSAIPAAEAAVPAEKPEEKSEEKPVVESEEPPVKAAVPAAEYTSERRGEESAQVLVEKKRIEEIYAEMLKSGKLYCAAAYLKSLEAVYPEYGKLYQQLAYAVNDPMSHSAYSSGKIFDVYYTSSQHIAEHYIVAATLRNYFYDQCSYDHDLQRLQGTINGLSILSDNQALNQLTYALSEFKINHNKGMDCYAEYHFKDLSEIEKRVKELQQEAKDLYSRLADGKSKDTASFKRFIETKKLVFAKTAMLASCLKLVEEDKRSESELIKEFLIESYIEEGKPVSSDNIDAGKIHKVIEDAWLKAEKTLMVKKNSTDLMGSRYNNILQNIKRIVSLLCDYVLTIGDHKIDTRDAAFIDYKRTRPSLLKNLSAALKELNADPAPERSVLTATLLELYEKISGSYEENRHKYFYLDFLRSDFVLLDDDYIPVLTPIAYLDGMSPDKRIQQHFMAAGAPFTQRLKDIFNGADDYGSAELILRWMKQHQNGDAEIPQYEDDFDDASVQPLEEMENRHRSFVADLEMAQSQGQIDNTDGNYKDSVLQTVDQWHTILEDSRNFGFFYKILSAFRNQIRVNAQIRAKDMNASLEAYLQKNPQWETDEDKSAVIKLIRTRIENQNYTAAEDLLNRLLAGDTEFDAELRQKDYLAEFLGEYSFYNGQVGNMQKTVQQLMKTQGMNKDTRGASRLVENWPTGNSVGKEKIINLFMAMGFKIDPAEVKKLDPINRKEQFVIRLKSPEKGRKANYKHPIYVFGSEAEKVDFRVVCIYGKMDADRLTETFKDIGNTKNTILLLDFALTLPDRRKLARKAKADFGGKTFAVIDRIVLAYLAWHYSETEINRRLMAVIMPYAAFQPYVADSGKVMPPEIFMGRKTELEKIETAEGVNIVYGGRQLGKSALLRMAQKDIDHNENGDRAVLVDIKGKDYQDAARKVSAALSDEQFFSKELITEDWGELARAIKNRLRNDAEKIPYFLLLMDEADAFIESCGKIGYAPFDDLKDIQGLGTGRFKFVVAGLRNVVRFKRDAALGNNSVLTHLSSLTVKPFRYTEARELLETPLSYLGFRFPDDEKTDSLISNICGATNYFPGLIQLYCTKLLEAMKHDYAGYSEAETPPYFVREEHVKRALADKTLTAQIKEKFDITLKIGDDDYYYIIALLGAFLYHDSGNNSFSAASILEAATDYAIAKIEALDVEQVDALMQEMCDLNVLQDTGTGCYRFARYSFYQMMGTISDIEEEILKYGTSEV